MAMSRGPIILVTGANRGIGFSIIQATALRLPTATYLLGSRSLGPGEEAITKFRNLGVAAEMHVLELDVSNDESILAAVSTVKEKFGRLDGKSSSFLLVNLGWFLGCRLGESE